MATWKDHQSSLKGPIEIGDSGQIKEWYEETTVNSMGQGYGHRHISHMLGLFPGDLISSDTPEYFEAARVSMKVPAGEWDSESIHGQDWQMETVHIS